MLKLFQIPTWKLSRKIYQTKYCFLQPLCRKLSSNKNGDFIREQDLKQSEGIEDGYVTVYKFSFIRHASAFSKLKKYQVFLTAAGIPTSIVLAQNGIISTEMVTTTIYLGLNLCMALFTSGFISQRLIGFIYFNEKNNRVKVAYLDFWGNRKEKEMQMDDIIPISEASVNYVTSYLYSPFQQFSNKEVLKINLKYCQILHKENFNKLFLIDSK